jgi:hypothetical protein
MLRLGASAPYIDIQREGTVTRGRDHRLLVCASSAAARRASRKCTVVTVQQQNLKEGANAPDAPASS